MEPGKQLPERVAAEHFFFLAPAASSFAPAPAPSLSFANELFCVLKPLYLPLNALLMAAQSQLLSRVIDVLSDFPSPEAVMDLQTNAAEELRLEELAAKNEAGMLTFEEKIELEHYRVAEHMVRVAKARAYSRLMKA